MRTRSTGTGRHAGPHSRARRGPANGRLTRTERTTVDRLSWSGRALRHEEIPGLRDGRARAPRACPERRREAGSVWLPDRRAEVRLAALPADPASGRLAGRARRRRHGRARRCWSGRRQRCARSWRRPINRSGRRRRFVQARRHRLPGPRQYLSGTSGRYRSGGCWRWASGRHHGCRGKRRHARRSGRRRQWQGRRRRGLSGRMRHRRAAARQRRTNGRGGPAHGPFGRGHFRSSRFRGLLFDGGGSRSLRLRLAYGSSRRVFHHRRSVHAGLGLFDGRCGARPRLVILVSFAAALQQPPQPDRDILVDRAGVGLLFRNAQLGQPVKDLVRFDFQLPGQLINANLVHRNNTVLRRRTLLALRTAIFRFVVGLAPRI